VPTPEVNLLPALGANYITFGCLNNFGKVTPPTLRLWAEILAQVPRSRLLLHAKEGEHRQRVRLTLAEHGIAADRIHFVTQAPPTDYFRLYHQIDIALDPIPYGGGTTTCDALWMGVPVLTVSGGTAVGRGGVSILSNMGLQEFIARTYEDYVHLATTLAADSQRLVELRGSLRERMRLSPLMDSAQFARDVEGIYRRMWRRWCQDQGGR
jgi:predicted O-linked N-acetylglucosamine transferase (SPINDLY family)